MSYHSDGEVLIGTAHSSCTVQKMMHSVASLWEMHMPPEFVSQVCS